MSRAARPLILGLGLCLLVFLSPWIKERAKDCAEVRAEGRARPSLASGSPLAPPIAGDGQGLSLMPPAFTLGYDHLLADYYWLAFVSYAGDSRARQSDKYVLADRYLDIVTRLDPHFIEAYWFCAFCVGADQGRPDLAQKIIDRGIAANPFNWSLPFIGGFNQFIFAGNELSAARYYRMAARFPEAPRWLSGQALLLERGIPRIYKQIGIWEKIYNSQNSPLVKEKARDTLTGLWLTVYKNAPDQETRARAAAALRGLQPEITNPGEHEKKQAGELE
jgi:hypothetical protein